MQTATGWLIDKIVQDQMYKAISQKEWIGIFEQAKEMEKQQIMDAFDEGQEYEYQYHINNAPKFYSETYYAETYGSKGSDEHHEDNLDETPTSSKTEISDEMSKIEKALYHAWSDYEYKEGNLYSTTFRDGWLMAIKWHKKQLKSK